MASRFVVETNRLTDKFYEEMRAIYPNFSTNDREHLLVITAISLVVKENIEGKSNTTKKE